MDKSSVKAISEKIHWITGEEMLFSERHKYLLELPEEFALRINFYRFTAAHPIVPNYHDFYEISCIFRGDAVFHAADHDVNVRAGSIVFIRAGTMHALEADPRKPLLSASIYFLPELILHTGSNPYENGYLLPFMSSDGGHPPILHQKDLGIFLWNIVLDMYQELDDAKDFHQLALKNRLCEILLASLRTMKRLDMIPKEQAPQNRIERLSGVLDHIQHHYSEPLTLQRLAELAFMNPSYFCRYFKQVIGLSPISYLLRYRIDKAKELLLNSSLSITEVSSGAGFNSQSYFNRIFQRFTRMNPRHFRQQYAESVHEKQTAPERMDPPGRDP
jgi:AraC-like DNA-binding protein/quercetin dioxygenase-like cupin family protein